MAARQIGDATPQIGDNSLIGIGFFDRPLFDGCLIGARPDSERWT